MRALQMMLLLILACRDPDETRTRLFTEGFEERCDAIPCGWTQLEGPSGAVRYVETFHPGEHGLRIDAGAKANGPSGNVASVVLMSSSLQVAVSGRCERGARLEVEAALRDTASGVADTFRGQGSLPETWGASRRVITITSDSALVDGGLGGGFGALSVDIELIGLTLAVQGEGSCDVDYVVVDAVGFGSGLFPDGC